MLPSGEKLFGAQPRSRAWIRHGLTIALLLAAAFLAHLALEAMRPRDPGETTFPCHEIEARIRQLGERPADDYSPDYRSVQVRCAFIAQAVPLYRTMARCDKQPQYPPPPGGWDDIEMRLDATLVKHRQECGW